MTIVVLDTNVLVDSPRLGKRAWESLVEHSEAWRVRLVVPEVVFMETVNVVKRRWVEERDRLASLKLGAFAVTDHVAAIISSIETQINGYEEWLAGYFTEHDIAIEPIPAIDHMDIARRASSGRTPFTRAKDGKTKDGYRDTLIWMTVISMAQQNNQEEVWLVSNNFHDFGRRSDGHQISEGADSIDTAHLFHEELADDLAAHELGDRVHYAVSIDRLEQHFAAHFAPIPESEAQRRVDMFDSETLASELVNAVIGMDVDPESAALPFEVVSAEILGVRRPKKEDWKFTEAAGRGPTGWTARFAVDTETDVSLLGGSLVPPEHTKILRVNGQLTAGVDGQIIELAVESVEALPTDPARARWSRRAERHPIDMTTFTRIADLLKQQQEDWPSFVASSKLGRVHEIPDTTPAFTGLSDLLKAQQEEWTNSLRKAMEAGGLVDSVKELQDRIANVVRDTTSGFSDILKAQQEEWARSIHEASPFFTKFAESLGDHQHRWEDLMPDLPGSPHRNGSSPTGNQVEGEIPNAPDPDDDSDASESGTAGHDL